MIFNEMVQDKMSCFDTWVPDIQHFFSDNLWCPIAISIPDLTYQYIFLYNFFEVTAETGFHHLHKKGAENIQILWGFWGYQKR